MKDVAEALANLEQAAGNNYWHITKGKTRPDEPTYAAAIFSCLITEEEEEPLAIAEGENLADVINECARKFASPEVPVPSLM